MSTQTVTHGQMHLLRLCDRDADAEGWAKVSRQVLPLVKSVPSELIVCEFSDDGSGRARVTDTGRVLLQWKIIP